MRGNFDAAYRRNVGLGLGDIAGEDDAAAAETGNFDAKGSCLPRNQGDLSGRRGSSSSFLQRPAAASLPLKRPGGANSEPGSTPSMGPHLTAVISRCNSEGELWSLLEEAAGHRDKSSPPPFILNAIHICAAAGAVKKMRTAVHQQQQEGGRGVEDSGGKIEDQVGPDVALWLRDFLLSPPGTAVLLSAEPRELSGIAWAMAKLFPKDVRYATLGNEILAHSISNFFLPHRLLVS